MDPIEKSIQHLTEERDRLNKQAAAIGRAFAPMLATSGPFPPDNDKWCYEVKWDGRRALLTIDGKVTVHTRRGRNATADFPELAPMADTLKGRRVVLDGEQVAARDGSL